MNHELKIIPTADGSNTIFNARVGENYHSKHGALQESRHVFINAGLQYFLDKKMFLSEEKPKVPPAAEYLEVPLLSEEYIKVSPTGGDLEGAQSISILEVGFGTGLNFLLSADLCTKKEINLDYTGIEAYPLNIEMISQTGYDQYVSKSLWQTFINKYPQSLLAPVQLNHLCRLQTADCKLLNFTADRQYDIIYFDGFASAYQPEMWDETAITHTIKYLKPGGVFVTYAITGNLKRMLKALGCKIEKVPGAAGKKGDVESCEAVTGV